jgi:hypothetical protein
MYGHWLTPVTSQHHAHIYQGLPALQVFNALLTAFSTQEDLSLL